MVVQRSPRRGEVWLADFSPVIGHEQGGRRPGLVLSIDEFNHGPAGLITILPITSRFRGIPIHILVDPVDPPEAGLQLRSAIMPEMIRSVSIERLLHPLGRVSKETLQQASAHVMMLLGLESME
jgi:mRNA interferase MazF